jgi:ELWxxDGT repeat protein
MLKPRPSHAISRAAILICVIVTAAHAQLAIRVKDINTSSGDGFTQGQFFEPPPEFVTWNGSTYFRAISGLQNGTGELWRTDGTPSGTVLVKDIDPAHGSNSLAVAGNLLFIFASTPDARELWRSDGTSAGTLRIKVFPNTFPQFVGSIGNTVLFATGSDLWRSDGTESGTFLVKNVFPSEAVAFGGALFFSGFQQSTGRELWRTDGTTAGTVLVTDINPGAPDGLFTEPPVVAGNTMYFAASGAGLGFELWKSDGTAAGTVLVKDIEPGVLGSLPTELTAIGTTLAFVASEAGGGFELWKTDGTTGGTMRVKDIVPGPGSSSPRHLTPVGNVLYFQAFDTVTGTELWKSDGTEIGTVLVKDIQLGTGSSAPIGLVAVGNALFFAAVDSETGSELWKSDGTAGGTLRVRDIFPGPGSSTPLGLHDAGGLLLFTALTPEAGVELWRSDGSAGGTILVKDINLTAAGSSPRELTSLGETLFFQAFNPTTGAELWKSDGTAAGTVLVKDINPGPAGSMPYALTPLGNMLLFFAQEPNTGVELWRTDGTSEGTVLVKDVVSGPDIRIPPPPPIAVMGGRAFFIIYQSVGGTLTGFELWKSDGTEEGTVLVSNLPDFPSELIRAGNTLFLTGGGQRFFSRGLWGTDATAEGLTPLVGLVSDLTATPNLLFFVVLRPSAQDPGYELWRSDGTREGTFRIFSIIGSQAMDSLTPVGDTLFFTSFEADTGRELWKTDGTTAGTVRVKDIFPGPESSFRGQGGFPETMIAVDGLLFFNACAPVTGCELWKSDGTEAGTALVKDISPGSGNSIGDLPLTGVDADGVLFFRATNGSLGLEPWVSGGTARDTFMLQDIAPGPRSSSPDLFTPVGENVFFVADDGVTGRELWVFQASEKNLKFAGKKHPKLFKGNGRGPHTPKPDKDHSSGPDRLESVLHGIR